MASGFVTRAADQVWETWDDPALARRSPVQWKTLISGERTASEALSLGVAQIPPGETLIRHYHAPPEVYYVIAGAGVVEIDGAAFDVGPGSAVFIPGNASHRFTNTGASVVQFVYVFPVDAFPKIEYVFVDDEPTYAPTD
jgi:mannose-6-phosphate isomerase-like protein (cupin superfamily)